MLAGRALDVLVAEKVMGWTCVTATLWQTETGKFRSDVPTGIEPFMPSTDIAAAW